MRRMWAVSIETGNAFLLILGYDRAEDATAVDLGLGGGGVTPVTLFNGGMNCDLCPTPTRLSFWQFDDWRI